MKKIFLIASALASVMLVSCVTNHYGEDQSEKDGIDNPRNAEASFITPAKKPAVKESQIKKDLEYDLILNNQKNFVTELPIGHYEVEPESLEMLAALDANGLITLKSKSIKKSGDNDRDYNYSIWVDVALTSKGKKYIEKGQSYSSIVALDKKAYDRIINPARDRNAYGELEEEAAEGEVRQLFVNFYTAAVSSLKNAIKTYGEAEFIDTYDRVLKIDSYLRVVTPGVSMVSDRTFFDGVALSAEKAASLVVSKVTRFEDCYKVYLDEDHYVVYILDENHEKIFDVVYNSSDLSSASKTIRTENKKWSDKMVKEYAEMAATPAETVKTEEELGIERDWNAPGLIPVIQNDESRYVYPMECKYAISEKVPILLYRNVVDKVYKIMVTSSPNVTSLGSENAKILTYDFRATAKAVIKKVDISPFQRVLQNYYAATPITENNVFETKDVKLSYCDERGWFAEFSDGMDNNSDVMIEPVIEYPSRDYEAGSWSEISSYFTDYQ